MNFSGKRLVVFGAGYVGSALAQSAATRGLQVTALTRNPAKAAPLASAGIETIVADLAATDWHSRIAPGADFVVICVGSGGGGPEGYRHSYVAGMRSVLAWVGREPASTLVYTSSTAVYPQEGGVTVEETAPTGGPAETTQLLLEAENLLLASGGLDGGVPPPFSSPTAARAFVLRLAGIYGPGRHHLLDALRTGAGEIAGRGDHRLNLIHRDDICAAIWAALTAPATVPGGIFNVADDGAAPKSEVVAWLAARLGVPPPHFTGAPTEGRRRLTPDRVIANAKLKHTLGWRPIYPTYREGYAAH